MINGIENLRAMRETVKAELQDIPRGNFLQNLLRTYYWSLRMNSLGKRATSQKTKQDVFTEAVELMRKEDSAFVPVCKGDFEKIKLMTFASR